jgi:hypothetical protein
MATVVVSSVIAHKPLNGGNAWAVLNWVLGLKRLGLDVFFLEQIARANCHDRAGAPTAFEESENLAYFRRITERFGLSRSAALIGDEGAQVHGLTAAELLDLAESTDLLINISGHLTLKPLMSRIRRKAFIDFDPGFTQYWHAAGDAGARLAGHDWYFTLGANIGTPACSIPTGGIPWRPTRPPVVLDQCPVAPVGDPNRFTTVASWRGAYGRVQHGDRLFGLKAHEFRKLIDLPRRAPQTFEIALEIHPADARDRDALEHHGWRIADPKTVAPDADAFQRYVQASSAEFSVAQGIYVETQCGWFSDRTVRYLASGKPVLVQDTGFSRRFPVGEGLLAFRTRDEAVAGAERLARDYRGHCQAARELAESFFDSDTVLGNLIDAIGIKP